MEVGVRRNRKLFMALVVTTLLGGVLQLIPSFTQRFHCSSVRDKEIRLNNFICVGMEFNSFDVSGMIRVFTGNI